MWKKGFKIRQVKVERDKLGRDENEKLGFLKNLIKE